MFLYFYSTLIALILGSVVLIPPTIGHLITLIMHSWWKGVKVSMPHETYCLMSWSSDSAENHRIVSLLAQPLIFLNLQRCCWFLKTIISIDRSPSDDKHFHASTEKVCNFLCRRFTTSIPTCLVILTYLHQSFVAFPHVLLNLSRNLTIEVFLYSKWHRKHQCGFTSCRSWLYFSPWQMPS